MWSKIPFSGLDVSQIFFSLLILYQSGQTHIWCYIIYFGTFHLGSLSILFTVYLMVWPVFCHFLINHTETNCVIKGWSMVPKPNLSLCLIWKEAELFTITCILVLQPPERAFISYFLPFRHLQNGEWYFVTTIVLTYCEKKLF